MECENFVHSLDHPLSEPRKTGIRYPCSYETGSTELSACQSTLWDRCRIQTYKAGTSSHQRLASLRLLQLVSTDVIHVDGEADEEDEVDSVD